MAAGRILVVSWGGGGNLTPALALAARLTRAGHEVVFLADAEPAGRSALHDGMTAAGATLRSYPSVEPWPDGVTLEDDPQRFDEIRNGLATGRDILAVAAEVEPSALVVDCMTGAGLVAAEVLGIPTAVLVHVLYQPFVTLWADMSVDVNRCRAALGLPELPPPAVLGQLERLARVLVLVPQSFDYPDPPVTDATCYVGPILDPDPPPAPGDLGFAVDDRRPLVLVSLSTTPMGQAAAFPPILEALGRLPVRALVTLGRVAVDLPSLPANVVVRDHLPHAAVLPQVSAVVSHAGLSTVMASLAHGVPLVCIPQGREQPLNADRVQACGAGITLPTGATPEAIGAAVATVLDDGTYRAAARSMAEAIAELGRGQLAADLVQSLCSPAG